MRISSVLLSALSLMAPIVSGAAVPAAEHAPETRKDTTLASRDSDEILYVSNCRRLTPGGGQYLASYAAWYGNWRNSMGDQFPDALTNEYRDWTHDGGTTITFEGREQVFGFPNGPTLYIHIDGGGLYAGFQNYAGYIDREQGGTWTRFSCYRDSDRSLFSKRDFAPESAWPTIYCNSLYYCHY